MDLPRDTQDDSAESLYGRYERHGNKEDLERCITIWREKIRSAGNDDLQKTYCALHNLGNALRTRFEDFGQMDDLEESITSCRRALELTPEGSPDFSSQLSNLGSALLTRYGSSGNSVDLQDAIIYHTRAIELTPEGSPYMPMWLNKLGIALKTRYEFSGNSLTPEGSPYMPTWLNSLGNTLLRQYEFSGNSVDLQDTIIHYTHAIELTPESSPNMPMWLNNLGNALLTRYESSGNSVDLQDAIIHYTHVIELTPEENPYMPSRLNNLGLVLKTRYESSRNPVDLQDAIIHYTHAIQLTPEGNPYMPSRLDNLGNALLTQYESSGNSVDLQDAIIHYTHAIELTPESNPYMPSRLNNLGIALQTQYESSGNSIDLQDAIVHYTHAIELTPESSPVMSKWLYNLSLVLESQYRDNNHDPKILQESIALVSQAIDFACGSCLQKINYYCCLGNLICLRMKSAHKQVDDAVQAMRAFANAMEQISGDPYWRVQAGLQYVELLSTNPSMSTSSQFTKLQAHQYILDLIPQVIWLGHKVQKRYERLAKLRVSVSHAIADAITAEEYQQALEWLECSRAIVWAQVLQLHTPLDDLTQHHPQLASRLQAASTALQKDASEPSSITLTTSNSQPDSQDMVEPNGNGLTTSNSKSKTYSHTRAKDAYDFALEYDSIIKEIRTHEGFENFLRPKQAPQLMAACVPGPIVIINAHISRCDALVLTPEAIIPVPLPLFSYHHARELQLQLWSFVRRRPKARNGMRDSDGRDLTDLSHITDEDDTVDEQDKMRTILHDLWTQVVKPIIDTLQHNSLFTTNHDGTLPHITWCPTGPLVFLPLHAAGIYPPHGLSETIMDVAVSSYTPTLEVLLRPRTRKSDHNDLATRNYPELLVVTQPNAPGYNEIPRTVDEAKEIRRAMPTPVNVVDRQNGTVEAVLEGMRTHDWVHLACHGMQDRENRLN
ncbi:hypothetical protein BDY19DRAFT_1060770, partial [Irpex rosettiformis]